jgi:hypothetical protein
MSLIVLAGIVAALTAAYWQYTQDDVFITYAYSRSLAQGDGFVFYPGERVQGTTTPLYTLLMAGVHLLTDDMLHAGNLLSAVLLLASCALILELTRRHIPHLAAFAACLLLVTSPIVYVSYGMETLLVVFLLMLAFWLWERDQQLLAIVAAAALTWTRPDGVVLAGTLGLVALINSRRIPWRLALTYTLIITPWFVFAWLYFGTPLPNTFSAKEETLSGLKFINDGIGWWQTFYGGNLLAPMAFPLIPIGMWRAWQTDRLRPLVLWPIFYVIGYTLLNVTAFWYYTPLVAVLLVLTAFGGVQAASWVLQRSGTSRAGQTVQAVGVSVAVVAAGFSATSALRFSEPPPRVATYRELGQWIDAHLPPEDNILVGDLGIVGYHAQRRTLDVPGLIVPEMYWKEEEYAVVKFRPDHIVATQYFTWQRLMAQEWLTDYYRPLAQFVRPGDAFTPMVVYERRYPLSTPEEAIQGAGLALTCEVQVAEGERLPATTQARLFTAEGQPAVEVTQPFLEGEYPSERAPIAEVLLEQIVLPTDVPPGPYTWELTCAGEAQHGEVTVLPMSVAPSYTSLDSAVWGEFMTLEGVAYPQGLELWAGGTLSVLMEWSPLAEPPEETISAFVHVLNADGVVVAQSDGSPGGRPAPTWEVGSTLTDQRRIVLPADLPAGDYQLAVGLYNWQTQERYPLPDGSDARLLPGVLTVQVP